MASELCRDDVPVLCLRRRLQPNFLHSWLHTSQSDSLMSSGVFKSTWGVNRAKHVCLCASLASSALGLHGLEAGSPRHPGALALCMACLPLLVVYCQLPHLILCTYFFKSLPMPSYCYCVSILTDPDLLVACRVIFSYYAIRY
jgi:hypothetical protein